MGLESNIIVVIVITSIATFLSRFLGVLTSKNMSTDSNIFIWFNLVAYATLASLLARMIIFPAGVLAEANLVLRLAVLIICIGIYLIFKRNLILPTAFSAVILSLLNYYF